MEEDYEDTTLEDVLNPLYDTNPLNSDSYINYLNGY